MKKLLMVFIFIQVVCLAQFDDLELISLQGIAHSDYSKSFLFQNNDSLFYFYPNSTQGLYLNVSQGAQVWYRYKEIYFPGLPATDQRGYDIYQKDDGTFLITRLFFGGQLKVFSYNATTNELTQLGVSLSASGTGVEFTYINDSSFILSIKDANNNVSYYLTTDAASSWSEEKFFTGVAKNNRALNIAAKDGVLYTTYVSEDSLSINLLTSTDSGLSWEVTEDIYTSVDKISNASVHKKLNELYIVFEEYLYVDLINNFQSDIVYIMSSDDGNTWSGKVKYTKFIGNDTIAGINNSNSDIFALTLSSRIPFEIGLLDTYAGKLTSSSDPAPPIVYSSDIPTSLSFDKEFDITLFVNDESGISSLYADFDGQQYELLDDGLHNDSLAGDNIFGNTIAGYSSSNPNVSSRISVNNISIPFSNAGRLGDITDRAYPELTISINDINGNDLNFTNIYSVWSDDKSGGIYKEKVFLFSGGFILSGYANSNLWGNAVASVILTEDYVPGPIGSNPNDPENLIYTIKSSDTPFGSSWQNWSKAVEQGASFYDGNNDGIYEPVDLNGNGSWDTDEDKPDLLYDATHFTVFNDGVPATERKWDTIDPLGIEIRQTVFGSDRNTLLDGVVFIRYSIVYKGLDSPADPDSLTDVVLSLYVDDDIGTSNATTDDKTGCDTTLHAGYTFNDGEDDTWGANPPAVFEAIVQGPIVRSNNSGDIAYNRMGPDLGVEEFPGYKNLGMTSYTSPQKGTGDHGEPTTFEEARFYSLGLGLDGIEVDPCNFTYGQVLGNVNCADVNPMFWFSGNPITNNGWIYSDFRDIRNQVNTGPFALHKNEPMDIIVAYVVGQGNDALNSITKAREITQYVHEEYERNFSTVVGVEDKDEVINKFSLSQNYPNPFNPTSTIKYQIAKLGKVELKIYDILGREISTLVNEVKAPGTYEVTFDASHLASGVYFYRLTSGSFVQTKKMILIK